MLQFNPGEERVAIATFPTKPAGLPCTAELWLASDMTKVATSNGIPFIASGEDKSISLPITLPGVEGAYPVYLEVFSNGQRIAVFRGDEDVIIKPPEVRTVRAYYKTMVTMFPAGKDNGVTYDGKREVDPNYFGSTTEWTLASTFVIPVDAAITEIEFDMLYTYGYNRFDYRWTDQKPGETERTIAEGYVEPPPNMYWHYTIPISS